MKTLFIKNCVIWNSQIFLDAVHQMAEAPATLEDIAEFSDPEEENEGDSVGILEVWKAQCLLWLDNDTETPEQSAINWIRHKIQIPVNNLSLFFSDYDFHVYVETLLT